MGHIPAAGRPHGAAPVPAEHVKSCPLCLLYKGKASELRISAQTVRRGGGRRDRKRSQKKANRCGWRRGGGEGGRSDLAAAMLRCLWAAWATELRPNITPHRCGIGTEEPCGPLGPSPCRHRVAEPKAAPRPALGPQRGSVRFARRQHGNSTERLLQPQACLPHSRCQALRGGGGGGPAHPVCHSTTSPQQRGMERNIPEPP